MTDSTGDIDRLARGLLLTAASLSSGYAIAPLGLPAQTMEYAAFTALCAAAYGIYQAMTAAPTIAALERIVPEQYH